MELIKRIWEISDRFLNEMNPYFLLPTPTPQPDRTAAESVDSAGVKHSLPKLGRFCESSRRGGLAPVTQMQSE